MLTLALRVLAIACIVPGLFHLLFGAGGDWLIGVDPLQPIDPSLDSQNRFYGAIFIGYGATIWLATADIEAHGRLIRLLLLIMALGACGRGLSILLHGPTTIEVTALWISECLIPPFFWVWLSRQSALHQ